MALTGSDEPYLALVESQDIALDMWASQGCIPELCQHHLSSGRSMLR